jgi:hypothetical protein
LNAQDGVIVVARGILASNYIAMQQKLESSVSDTMHDTGYVELSSIGTIGVLHQVDVAHMWLSPFRILCEWDSVNFGICTSFTREGILSYVSWGLDLVRTMERQGLFAQLLTLIPIMLLLSVFMTFEHLLKAVHGAPVDTFLYVTAVLLWIGYKVGRSVQVRSKQKMLC